MVLGLVGMVLPAWETRPGTQQGWPPQGHPCLPLTTASWDFRSQLPRTPPHPEGSPLSSSVSQETVYTEGPAGTGSPLLSPPWRPSPRLAPVQGYAAPPQSCLPVHLCVLDHSADWAFQLGALWASKVLPQPPCRPLATFLDDHKFQDPTCRRVR